MWNNNSSCLLSVYAPDTWCIWRCMHMRMLVCSDVLVLTPTFFPQRKLKIKKTVRIKYAGCYFLFLSPVPGILIMKFNRNQEPSNTPWVSHSPSWTPSLPQDLHPTERGRWADNWGSPDHWLPSSLAPHLCALSIYIALCNQWAVHLHKAQSPEKNISGSQGPGG